MKKTNGFLPVVGCVILALATPETARASRRGPATVADFRECARARIEAIRATPNREVPPGTKAYYISEKHGDDAADGRTPETAWRTSSRLKEQGPLDAGSWVLFERGGIYRGTVWACSNCTYTAYGEGTKPCIYGSSVNGADAKKWTQTDNPKVWAYPIGHCDVGTLVFNDGEAHAIKVLCRTDRQTGKKTNLATGKPFGSYRDLDRDLHFWHDYYEKGTGCVYLYSEENPGRRFRSIEFNERRHGVFVGGPNVTIDNLCIKYAGYHGIGAGTCKGLHVANCEFAWIGGSIQSENLGGRDYPTRFGNAVEIYGGCDDYSVVDCYIRQVYDAGVTFQITTNDRVDHKNVQIKGNVIEHCNYSIEYFLLPYNGKDNPNTMENVLFEKNLMFDAGYGFCEQRPDRNDSAHIKSWGAVVGNRAKNFVIRKNAMIGAKDMIVQIGSLLKNHDGRSSLPVLERNVFAGRVRQSFGVVSDRSNDRLPYGPETQTVVDAFGVGNRCLFEDSGVKCRTDQVAGLGSPRLKFGVVSDIHVSRLSTKPETYAYGNSTTFKAALEYFRDQGVDAVICPGDMSDRGVTWMLDVCGQVWRQVFPGNRAPDGRKVEPIFVYGNHDSDRGWFDGASGLLNGKSEAEAEAIKAKSISRNEAAAWEHAFGEPWKPVYLKLVKGYAFVGVHWGHEGMLPAFLAAHRDELKGAKPFFEVQHPHPKGTLYGGYTWGEDSGATTKALAGFPNAVSLSGHSHTSIALDASVWQGAFTAIGCSSLSYQSLFGRKNVLNVSPKDNRYAAASSSHREGMLVTVYDDCLEIERREFVRGETLGPNWVIPLPAAEGRRPFSYEVQKKRLLPPEFPKGAKLTVTKTKDCIEIGLPSALHAPDRTRTIWYELTVLDGGKPVYSATLLADGFFAPFGKIPQPAVFKVRPDELPAGGDLRYEVVARDIFDRVSRPLATNE